MAREIFGRCKDCNKDILISEFVLNVKKKQGESRPERCADCRSSHSTSVKLLGNSHFYLKHRPEKSSLLGGFSLGDISHQNRTWNTIDFEIDKQANRKMRSNIKVNDNADMIALYEKLKDNQVVVAISPTGTGKSTYLPYRLLEPSKDAFEKVFGIEFDKNYFSRYGPIIITQPRIGATKGIANAVAQKLYGCNVGEGCEIGYRHGDGDSKKSKEESGTQFDRYTRLIYVTDGSLSSQWINKGSLDKVSIIIIDEAHERSLNIDKILLTLRQELPKNPHLKLIIASATIDESKFVNYYKDVSKVDVLDFRKYDSEKKYKREFQKKLIIKDPSDSSIVDKLVKEVLFFYDESVKRRKQSILGFLPTVSMVEEACDKINTFFKGKKTKEKPEVISLYADRPNNIKKANKDIGSTVRRIFIGTNIAETSLTISDLDFVVDSGLQNYIKWNPKTLTKKAQINWHSQSGCRQRWGRVGRVREGWVKTLYTEEQFNAFNEHTPVGIENENVENLLLELNESGVTNFSDSSLWMKKPEDSEIERIQNLFKKQGIIDDFEDEGDFTQDGFLIYKISKSIGKLLRENRSPMAERLIDVASILFQADKYGCLIEASTFIAMIDKVGDKLFSRDKKSNEDILEKELPNSRGVFLYDDNWSIVQKYNYVNRQKSFVRDCYDDLDLIFKIFNLFECSLDEKNEYFELSKTLLDDYKINIESLNETKQIRDDLARNNHFSRGNSSNLFRPLSPFGTEKLRILLSYFWQDKTSEIQQEKQESFFKINGVRGRFSVNSSVSSKIKKELNYCIPIYSNYEYFHSIEDVLNDEKTIVGGFVIQLSSTLPVDKTLYNIVNEIKKIDKSDLFNSFDFPDKEFFKSNLIDYNWLNSLRIGDEVSIKLIECFYDFSERRVLGFWGESDEGLSFCIDASYISNEPYNLGIDSEYLNETFEFVFKGKDKFGLPIFSILDKLEDDKQYFKEESFCYGVYNSFNLGKKEELYLTYRVTSLKGFCHFFKLVVFRNNFFVLKKINEDKVVFNLNQYLNNENEINYSIDMDSIETRKTFNEVIQLNSRIDTALLDIKTVDKETNEKTKELLNKLQDEIRGLSVVMSKHSNNKLEFKAKRCWLLRNYIGKSDFLSRRELKLFKLENKLLEIKLKKEDFKKLSDLNPQKRHYLNKYLKFLKTETDIKCELIELKPQIKLLKSEYPDIDRKILSIREGEVLITQLRYKINSEFSDEIIFSKTYLKKDSNELKESYNIDFIERNDKFFIKNRENQFFVINKEGNLSLEKRKSNFESISHALWKFKENGIMSKLDKSIIPIDSNNYILCSEHENKCLYFYFD